MTYLSRPVFPFGYDWSSQINRQVNYDLRTQQIGFGPLVEEPQQQYSANAYSMAADLPDECAVNAMERFVQGVYGRLQGFWLPTPERACEISAGVSATQFLAQSQGLAQTWANDPAIHLCFIDPNGVYDTQFAAISNVESLSAGVERVTLAAALNVAVDGGWAVHRLMYVRFSSDDLEMQFYASGAATCKIAVIELPVEYSSVELGDRPAYGYHFWRQPVGAARQDWWFTSFDQPIYILSSATQHLHQPAPITHDETTRSITGDREQTIINTWRFDGSPLNAWAPFAPQYDVFVEIVEIDLAGANASAGTLLFSGLVETVEPEGKQQRVTCSTPLDRLKSKLPRPRVQKMCNNALYDECCRVDRGAYSFVATVTSVDTFGRTLVLSAPGISAQPNGWFAFGDAQSLDADGLPEMRAIMSSTAGTAGSNQVTVALSSPFARLPVPGDSVTVSAGCDLSGKTCHEKFDNLVNMFACPRIGSNLSLKAATYATDGGGGKGGGKGGSSAGGSSAGGGGGGGPVREN